MFRSFFFKKSPSFGYLVLELGLYVSVFHQKRPDFDGIEQTYPFLLSPSQQSFWAQELNNILEIDQVMNIKGAFFTKKC